MTLSWNDSRRIFRLHFANLLRTSHFLGRKSTILINAEIRAQNFMTSFLIKPMLEFTKVWRFRKTLEDCVYGFHLSLHIWYDPIKLRFFKIFPFYMVVIRAYSDLYVRGYVKVLMKSLLVVTFWYFGFNSREYKHFVSTVVVQHSIPLEQILKFVWGKVYVILQRWSFTQRI